MEPKMNQKMKEDEKRRRSLLQLGLVASLSLCLCAFEYTERHVAAKPSGGETIEKSYFEEEKIIEVKINKPIPQENRQQEQRQNVTGAQVSVSTQIQVTSNNTPVDPNVAITTEPTGPIVLANPVFVDSAIVVTEFAIVEDMPYFPECAKIKNKKEREICTQQKMYELFGKNIHYPAMAREGGVQGTVFVSFRVNSGGKIDDVFIKRGVQEDLDKEALRVVNQLPDMIPGKQRGKEVNVRYVVPIKFKLN